MKRSHVALLVSPVLLWLVLMLLMLGLTEPAHSAPPADPLLAQAEDALARGAHGQALVLARATLGGSAASSDGVAALKIVGTASCLVGDAVTARRAADRLPPVDRLVLLELCARQGLVLGELPDGSIHPMLVTLRARRLYAEGMLRLSQGDSAQAEQLLWRSFRAEPAPQTLFEIVRCQVRAGKLARAVATHRRYVRSFRTPEQRLVAAARFGVLVDQAPSASAAPEL